MEMKVFVVFVILGLVSQHSIVFGSGSSIQDDDEEPPSLTPLVFLLVVLLALGLLVYILFYTIPVSRVEVKQGVQFVKLPFKTQHLLPEDTTVEWTRCAPEPMKVHEYRNGRNYPVRQDESYCDCTKMEMDPLHTRDLSLSLRNPCFRDSGSYICTVYKDRDILTQKVVRLRVKERGWFGF